MICALCHRSESIEPFRLTHGIVILLCSAHRDPAFLTRRGGTDFTCRLAERWAAHGVFTSRRRAALDAHVRACSPTPGERDLPGSYAWAELRRDIERRFATGSSVTDMLEFVRTTYPDCPAAIPSDRTIRRWFCERRWLRGRQRPCGNRARRRLPRPIPRVSGTHREGDGVSVHHDGPVAERRRRGP